MKIFIFLSLIALTFTGCKKKQADFNIKGTITDISLNQALSGATVEIYKLAIGSSNEEFYSSTTTSNSGEYSFSIPRDKSTGYTIKIIKSNYFELSESINFSDLSTTKDNIYNYSTSAKSWVRLHFVHSSGSSSDELQYTKQKGKTDCVECCSKNMNRIYGLVDTSIYCPNDGNTKYSYLYSFIGTSNTGIKEITTIPFDTVELLLNY